MDTTEFIKIEDEDVIKRMDPSRIYVEGFVSTVKGNRIMPAQYTKVADKVKNFKVRKDDIWLVTFPKCGTTWSQEMIWLLSNDYDYKTAKSITLNDRFPFFEISSLSSFFSKVITGEEVPLDASIEQVENMESPRFIKTHLPMELLPNELWTVKPKIIYVAREAKDVIVSFYHHQKLMIGYTGDFGTFTQSFMDGEMPWGPYWSHVIDFWDKREEPNVLFYTYESMQNDLAAVISGTAKFLGKEITDDEMERMLKHLNFKNMKDNPSVNFDSITHTLKEKNICKDVNANFMRKGKSGSYKEFMTDDVAEKVDTWSKEILKNSELNPFADFILNKK